MDDTIIVACATLEQELKFVMDELNCNYPVKWIDSGHHVWPDRLRAKIQETLDEIEPMYNTVLLVFGFCGNSMVGVKSGSRTLVLPSVADCIPIWLGSRAEKEKHGNYSYFFTDGYLSSEKTIINEYEYSKAKYGEKRAKRVMDTMLANYKSLLVVDTGTYEVEPVFETVKVFADQMDLTADKVKGNLRLIKELLSGNWDRNEFTVIPPGSEFTLEDSLNIGTAQ